MLREGLAQEFPSAKRGLDQLIAFARSAHVSRETAIWAAVSGFGASWIVATIGQAVVTPVRLVGLRDPAAWLSDAVTVLGYALAVAVAFRAGGRRGLLWFLAILAMQSALRVGISLPGFLTFCERNGSDCSLLPLAGPYAYVAAGLLAGAAVVRFIRSGVRRPNVFLNGAGLFTLLANPIGVAYYVVQPQDLVAASAMYFILNGAAGVLAGVVLRLRSQRRAPVGLLGGALALGWIATAGPFIFSALTDGFGPQPAALYVSGLVQAVALAAGWLATDARQRARTTAAA